MTYQITVVDEVFDISMTTEVFELHVQGVGAQGNTGATGQKGDTGALLNNITGAYLADAFQSQPLLKEASLYADLRNQVYAKGDRSGLTAADTFENLFDFSRATIGYAYNAAGTLTEYAVDVPRFEHDPLTGARNGLLIEPAQTNLLTYSSDFTAGLWSTDGSTVTANAVASPDGTMTADAVTQDSSAGNNHGLTFNLATSFVSGTAYTYSKFVKANGNDQVRFSWRSDWFPPDVEGSIDLDALTVSAAANASCSVEPLLDQWRRASCTATADATGTSPSDLFFDILDDTGQLTYDGDGTSGIYAWGAQIVTGPYAGSYIPTSGTAATRAADLLEVKPAVVADVVNATEGTVFVRFVPFVSSTAIPRVVTLHGGTFENRIQIDYTSTGSARFAVVVGGVTTQAPTFFGTLALGEENAIALMWGGGRVAASLNGAAVVEATGITLPSEFTGAQWFANVAQSANAAALLKEAAFFMAAKSDAQAQSLSS